jgi:RNA polymerase sigma-70 factor (ECF subfamily)
MRGFLASDTAGGVATADGWGAAPHAEGAVEKALLERLRQSDAGAIAAVYDAHHARVRAFAQRLVGDAAAAEDLVHDVFIGLPSAVRRLRDPSSLPSFLIAVAVNHARHHVRAAARRRRAHERLGAEPAAVVTTPEGHARRRELGAAIVRALDDLPIDQRVAFVLLEAEERTAVEVAAMLGVPEATLRTRLFHARRKLRERLASEAAEGFDAPTPE